MPSLGKDLVTIREYLGLTIQDVQNATKLPLDTLKMIESGEIFEQKVENITYVRSFVRTYARNLKLDEDLVTRALDQEEIGNYNHLLLSAFPELSKKVQPEKKKENEDKPHIKPDDTRNQETAKEKTDDSSLNKPEGKSRFIADFPDDETDTSEETVSLEPPETEAKTKTAPPVSSVNWADMGRKFSSSERKTPVWIIGAVVVLLAVLTGIYFLYQSDWLTSENQGLDEPPTPQSQSAPEGNSEGLTLDMSDEPQNNIDQQTAVLQDTLYLTIYAANDILDPVRVWSDLKPRIDPYWVEQGTAFNFEFSDTIRVRGQYARMLLFLNGHLIENFRQEYFNPEENAVELTRSLFDSDSEWAVEVPFEIPENVEPPDTVAFRPTF
jgi:hypothetical protein